MIEKDLDKVLNYMNQYVENVYEHVSEPMLNWKDLKLVLEEIERLNNIINEAREYITSYESISIMQGLMKEYSNYDLDIKTMNEMIRRYMVVHDELLEKLDKEN